ncbi:aminodeoxychorismate lyase [Dongshaea marina]|uniref:aminodeoxychorismate lyase n=1 Tax=Dongshaea marina TaxID=2047966 RepID=UPI00131F3679|nr:aminodeoxychorismate lyase [Dongshaea marina]
MSCELSASDRGLLYGDGIFTTICFKGGALQLWPYHLERLQQGCRRLSIPEPGEEELLAQLEPFLSAGEDRVVKIIITRGTGGRGYSMPSEASPSVLISEHPLPGHYSQWRQHGIRLGVCRQHLGHQPMLAGLKTLNRLEQVLLKKELDDSGFDEALVLDLDAKVTEAVSANIFWRHQGQIYTPNLELSGVCGVMRRWVIELCEKYGRKVREVRACVEELAAADEIWLTNALLGIAPVREFTKRSYVDWSVSRWLQEQPCVALT